MINPYTIIAFILGVLASGLVMRGVAAVKSKVA